MWDTLAVNQTGDAKGHNALPTTLTRASPSNSNSLPLGPGPLRLIKSQSPFGGAGVWLDYKHGLNRLSRKINRQIKKKLTDRILCAYNASMKNGNGTIWKNIEKLMTAHKLDIAKLSELSGISRQSLYNIKNKGSANTETIRKIADAFGVGPGYLME